MSKTKMLRFHVELMDVGNPKVWREIEVPASYTFEQFHKVLQVVFGWSDYHQYEFTDKEGYFGKATFRITIPSEYDAEYEEKTYNARRKKLQSVFPKTKHLTYVYDYGDNWHFEIFCEGSSTVDYPFAHCSDGGGATPPEDCGGTGGYEAMKLSFANQDDEEESFREWLGMKHNENWDPNFFPSQIRRYVNIALAYMHGDEQ